MRQKNMKWLLFTSLVFFATVFGCGNNENLAEAESLSAQASVYMADGEYEKALPLVRKAIRLRPQCAEYHVAAAMASVKTNDDMAAYRDYEKAQQILQDEAREDPERLDDLVMILLCMNRDEEAEKIFKNAKKELEGNYSIMKIQSVSELREMFSEFKIDKH